MSEETKEPIENKSTNKSNTPSPEEERKRQFERMKENLENKTQWEETKAAEVEIIFIGYMPL